jgi:hypothetical protein
MNAMVNISSANMNDLSKGAWLPLSATQQEMWLGQELTGSGEDNCIAEHIMIEVRLDEEEFVQALRCVFREVDSLRVHRGAGRKLIQHLDPLLSKIDL